MIEKGLNFMSTSRLIIPILSAGKREINCLVCVFFVVIVVETDNADTVGPIVIY